MASELRLRACGDLLAQKYIFSGLFFIIARKQVRNSGACRINYCVNCWAGHLKTLALIRKHKQGWFWRLARKFALWIPKRPRLSAGTALCALNIHARVKIKCDHLPKQKKYFGSHSLLRKYILYILFCILAECI